MWLAQICFRGVLFVRNEPHLVSSFTYLQKLQLHVGPFLSPFHVLIRRLKISRFSAVLICSGRLFHKITPSYLMLFKPKVVWFTLGTKIFRDCRLRECLNLLVLKS